MLSHLDRVLFPDRCEVIEIIPSQRYVYPIFKNGSSSLRIAARKNNWRIKINEQITQLTEIDVVIRNPLERFISGITHLCSMTHLVEITPRSILQQYYGLQKIICF
jgi:hypothetical protein